MLFAIGAGSQVVAVDDQSNYPLSAPKTKLSGFQPNIEAIAGYQRVGRGRSLVRSGSRLAPLARRGLGDVRRADGRAPVIVCARAMDTWLASPGMKASKAATTRNQATRSDAGAAGRASPTHRSPSAT